MSEGPGKALERFLNAQDRTYRDAIEEIRAGSKQTHWMWFVFPQIAGLGQSEISQYFSIADLAEAKAYLANPTLGSRLRECCTVLLTWAGKRDAEHIFGKVDALKLRSSMTLFEQAAEHPEPFAAILDRFFSGLRDDRTLDLLN